ncbi:MAG TPA: MraY family glycosyltransferase [Acetobacteraceae bacterium]|nr:MraY family glycosyltransferase [Acetobacteraceae bacterium]
MTNLAIARHLAFAAALAVISATCVLLMMRFGPIDHPDERKGHPAPTPKCGGVGIAVAFLVGIAVLYRFAEFTRLADPYFRGVILASALIAVVSFLDDVYDWPFVVKLAAQIAAATAAVASGLYLDRPRIPYIGPVDIGWLGPLATLLWIVFATNAMNFIDGLDGLAGGVTLLACCFFSGIAAAQGAWFAYFASLLLASGLIGFLPFNLPPARIFMGDVGSQFCGFVLAMLGVVAARFETVELSFMMVPMLLAGPLFDVAFTLARRLIAGLSVTRPHRGFIFQLAQRSGMPDLAIAATYWGFVLFGGACILAFLRAGSALKPVISVLPIIPQLAWLGYVRWRSVRAGILRWD